MSVNFAGESGARAARRRFLKSVGITAAGLGLGFGGSSAPAAAGEGALPGAGAEAWDAAGRSLPRDIRITGLKTFLIGHMVFVKVYTDEGITGLGEGSYRGRAKTVEAAIREQERMLVGRDPMQIEKLWQGMFRWPRARAGVILCSAISAIDIALWDIKGKLLGVPIYQLLGGAARDRIRLYVMVQRPTIEMIRERVRRRVDEGFTCVRTGIAWHEGSVLKRPWDLQRAVEIIRAIREEAGDSVDIIDDAHGLMTAEMVVEYAAAIEPYRLLFLEDPVQPENLDALEWIGRHTRIPLAIGEIMYGKYQFQPLVARRLVSYVRPDVIHAGGITECKKIAAMAEANFMDLAPHVAPGPVSNLASAHVAACSPNCSIVEMSGIPGTSRMFQEVFDNDVVVQDGYAMLPDRPGLGCELNEEAAAEYSYAETDLRRLKWDDGAPTDW